MRWMRYGKPWSGWADRKSSILIWPDKFFTPIRPCLIKYHDLVHVSSRPTRYGINTITGRTNRPRLFDAMSPNLTVQKVDWEVEYGIFIGLLNPCPVFGIHVYFFWSIK